MKVLILCLAANAAALSRSGGNTLTAEEKDQVKAREEMSDDNKDDALWKCFPDAARYVASQEDLSSCFKFYSSCMSLWQNNIEMLLGNKFGSYCYEASIHESPPLEREEKRNRLFDFIHNTASPWWVNLMDAAQKFAELREAKKEKKNQLIKKKKFMGSLMEDSLWKTSQDQTNDMLTTHEAQKQLNDLVANFTQSKLFGGQEQNEADGMLSILQRAKGGFMINFKDLVQENIPAGIFKVALEESSQRKLLSSRAEDEKKTTTTLGPDDSHEKNTGTKKITSARGGVSPTRYLHATPGLRMQRSSLADSQIMKEGFCRPFQKECSMWVPWDLANEVDKRKKVIQDELSKHCPECPRGKQSIVKNAPVACTFGNGLHETKRMEVVGGLAVGGKGSKVVGGTNVPLYGAVVDGDGKAVTTAVGSAGNYYATHGDHDAALNTICVCTNTRTPQAEDWACYGMRLKSDCENAAPRIIMQEPTHGLQASDSLQNEGESLTASCEHSGTPYEPVCNDGSSAVYFNSPGTKKNVNFHLYWPGGYFCFDETSCLKRARAYPMLVSAKDWEQETVMPGLFDPTEGGFAGWDHSMVSYCSSDAFVGAVNFGTESFPGVANYIMVEGTKVQLNAGTAEYPVMKQSKGTHFKGAHVVIAMIQTLVWEKNLGCDSKAGEFVVSGCSAGAIGMINHGDSIITYVQEGVRNKYGCAQTCVNDTTTLDDTNPFFIVKGANPVLWRGTAGPAAADLQDERCKDKRLDGKNGNSMKNNRGIQDGSDDEICTLPVECWVDGCKKGVDGTYTCGAQCYTDEHPKVDGGDFPLVDNCVCDIVNRFCTKDQSRSTTDGAGKTPVVKGSTTDPKDGPGGKDGVGNGATSAKNVLKAQATERLCTCKKNRQQCVPNKWVEPKITLIIDSAPLTTLPKTNKKDYLPLVKQAFSAVNQLYIKPGVPLWQPAYCQENFPGEPEKCAYATYRLPLMKTPHMVVGMLWDTFVPGEMITDGYAFPFGQEQKTWMHDFIGVTKKLMRKPSKNQNYLGISCYDHCVIENPFFWMLTAASAKTESSKKDREDSHRMTSQKILTETRKRNLNRHYVDECDVFNCGCLLSTPIYTSSALLQFMRDVIGFNVSSPR